MNFAEILLGLHKMKRNRIREMKRTDKLPDGVIRVSLPRIRGYVVVDPLDNSVLGVFAGTSSTEVWDLAQDLATKVSALRGRWIKSYPIYADPEFTHPDFAPLIPDKSKIPIGD